MKIFELQLIILLGLGLMFGISKAFKLDTKVLGWVILITTGLFSIIDIILTMKGISLS
jgi:hypothetical protein